MSRFFFLLLGALIFLPACDAHVIVNGFADQNSGCVYQRYLHGSVVDQFEIDGKFSESYAISLFGPRIKVRIVCQGEVVAEKNIGAFPAKIDFGNLKRPQRP